MRINDQLRIFYLVFGLIFIIQKYQLKFILIAFLSFVQFWVSAQGEHEIKFEKLTVQDGLSHSSVTCFLEDQQGYMWIGTYEGLNRYDGKEFKKFYHDPLDSMSLPNNSISTIFEDSKGLVWIGTIDGLSCYDRQSGEFYRINLSSNVQSIGDVFEDQNDNIWVSSKGEGLYKISDTGFELFTSSDQIFLDQAIVCLHVAPEHPDYLWIGTKFGFSKYHMLNGTSEHFKREEILGTEVLGVEVNDITSDSLGNLWIANDGRTVDYFDVKKHTFTMFECPISRVFVDSKNNLWGSSFSFGISKLIDQKNSTFIQYQHIYGDSNSLSGNGVVPMYEDRSGRMWFGTRAGVNFYDPNTINFNLFRNNPTLKESIKANNISGVFVDSDGDLWVGLSGRGANKITLSENGESIFRNDQIPLVIPNSSVDKDLAIMTIYEYKKDIILLGTISEGMFVYDKSTGQSRRYFLQEGDLDPLQNSSVYRFLEDDSDKLWILTRDGAKHYDIPNQRLILDGHPELINTEDFNGIYESEDGLLWFAGNTSGLIKYNQKTSELRVFQKENPVKPSLSFNSILCLFKDRADYLWLGTNGGGLNRFDLKTEEFKIFTKEDGLANDVIYSILQDEDDFLWISTNKGISRFDPKNETFNNFGVNEGLQGDEFNSRVGFTDYITGRMYFGGVNGLNSFKPRDFKADTIAHDLYFSGYNYFEVIDEKNIKREYNGVIKDKIQFSHTDHSLTLGLSYIDITNGYKSVYQYMLEPLNKDWVDLDRENKIALSRLTPGNYTLKARASNNNHHWSKESTLKILVIPPWWKRWWAIIGYALLLVGSFLTMYKIRIRQLLKYQSLRVKISSDLHDDVGGLLSGVAMQSELISYKIKGENKEELIEISQMSRKAMEGMRDIVWAIDSRKDKYENLIDRMRSYAEKNLRSKNIDVDFNLEGINTSNPIDPESRQNYYLIFKEAITNIVKHSDATNVKINFSKEGRILTLSIHDNGSIQTNDTTDGLGLSNMKMRAEALKGSISIQIEDGYKLILQVNS